MKVKVEKVPGASSPIEINHTTTVRSQLCNLKNVSNVNEDNDDNDDSDSRQR